MILLHVVECQIRTLPSIDIQSLLQGPRYSFGKLKLPILYCIQPLYTYLCHSAVPCHLFAPATYLPLICFCNLNTHQDKSPFHLSVPIVTWIKSYKKSIDIFDLAYFTDQKLEYSVTRSPPLQLLQKVQPEPQSLTLRQSTVLRVISYSYWLINLLHDSISYSQDRADCDPL